MDYSQEQADELEALSSIFADDLEEVRDSIPSGWSPQGPVWRVVIEPQHDEGEEALEVPLKIEVVFAHTPTYPDEPPLLKARGLQGISDADVGLLQGQLEEAMQDNLGMAMVYTLISAAQEWVQDKAASMAMPSVDPEAEKRRALEAEEARLAELRRHGHPVTPESFAEWRAKFDAEQALARAKLGDGKAEEKEGRLTGKQWFRQQEEAHLEVEEPELEADEEDGEAGLEGWGAGGEGGAEAEAAEDDDEDVDFEDSDADEDDEGLLDELLASTGR